MKNFVLSVLAGFAVFPSADAREPMLLKDKICLPFGSKELSQIGAENMDGQYTTKNAFSFGLAKIPPGCEVGFQTTEEQASSYTDEYMESIRTISYIRCPNGFKLADQLVNFANFDLKGCLETPLSLMNDVELCGHTQERLHSLPVKIIDGKVSCLSPQKPKSGPKKK